MTGIFADTSYFLAFLGPADQYHERALAWSRSLRDPIVTTEYVLVEVGNALTQGNDRVIFVDFYQQLRADANSQVVAASAELLDRGVELFSRRPDQSWSLTDCISFVVMSERRLTDALSADRDFEQAGFRALLRHDPASA